MSIFIIKFEDLPGGGVDIEASTDFDENSGGSSNAFKAGAIVTKKLRKLSGQRTTREDGLKASKEIIKNLFN